MNYFLHVCINYDKDGCDTAFSLLSIMKVVENSCRFNDSYGARLDTG